ncbi:hypothetical protein [Kribbella italica]|uniref:Uncharacterized protein n=1 Tax=Kribbella italica TaxID=1540520 RepID=A0A7W9MYN3_9ACTN|nr:hypothetical protein [Kribbella italica]MBB5841336.1 hypothetical protein [Kribbella italica]
MTPTAFDLDLDVIPVSDPTRDKEAVSPDEAKEVDEKCSLTPGTVNTYPVGIAACYLCC